MAARAVLEALPGVWRFERTLVSRNTATPSGKATGEARFEARDDELLQTETGVFTTSSQSFDFSRRYVFALDDEELSVFFVDPRPPYARAGLFQQLDFDDDSTRPSAAQGADHLCSSDTYVQTYRFAWSNNTLEAFSVEDRVRGPAKHWDSTTEYRCES